MMIYQHQKQQNKQFICKLLLKMEIHLEESLKYYDKFIVGSQYLKEYVMPHSNIKEKNMKSFLLVLIMTNILQKHIISIKNIFLLLVG